ncbi:BspA family leucine-rich repeat surface protein [Salmonella enterica subsp. enterica serovar Saintpaul]|nr:BspA family leucine-rich repeat surface protein [Salmonella enterica subsp. enterica serovar Saintpaul]
MFVDPDKPLPKPELQDDTLGVVLDGIIQISNARTELIGSADEFQKVTEQALIDANKAIDKLDTDVKAALADHTSKKGAVHGETKTTVGLDKKENWRPATMQEHELGQSKNTFVVPTGLHALVKKFLTIDPTNYIRSRVLPIASGGQLGNVTQWPFNWKEGEIVESFKDPMAYFTDTPWHFSTDQGVRIYPAMNGSDVLTQHTADPGRVKRAITPLGGTEVRVYNSTLDLRRTRPGVLRGESDTEPYGELVKASSHLFDRHSVFYMENTDVGVRAFNKVRLPFDKLVRPGYNDNWSGIIEAREESIYNIYTSFSKGNIGGYGNGIYLIVELDIFSYTSNGLVVKDGPGRPAETIATLGGRYNTLTYQFQNAKFKPFNRGTGTPGGMCMNIKDILNFTDAQADEFWANIDKDQVTKIAFDWTNRLNGDFSIRIPIGFYNKNKSKYINYYMDFGFHCEENTVNKTAVLSVRPLRDIDTNIQTLDANFDVVPSGRFISYAPTVANDVFHPLVFNGVFESQGGHIKTYTFYNRQYVGFYQHDVSDVGEWIANGDAIKPNLVKYYYGQMSTLNNDGMYGDHLRHIPLGIENGTINYFTQVRDWNQQYRSAIVNVDLDTAPVMLSELGHPYGPWRNNVTWINPDSTRIPDFLVVNSESGVAFDTSCLVFNTQNAFSGFSRYSYYPTDPDSTINGVDPVGIDDVILSHLARVGGGWSINHRQLFYFKNRLYFFSQCLSAAEWPADGYDCYYGWYDSAYLDVVTGGKTTIKLNGTPESKVTAKKMKVNTKASATNNWIEVQGRDSFINTDIYMMLMGQTGNASTYQLMVNLAPHNNFYFEFNLSVDNSLGTTDVVPNANPVDSIFPYSEASGFNVDYDTVIAYGTKTPQRLHVNFQTPVMMKKSMWSLRKTPGHYGAYAESIGTQVVNGGLMNAIEGTGIYPVGSAVTIGGSNIIVKKPVNASEKDFQGNDELFVRQNGQEIEMYGLKFNPNGYETEPNSGVAPCGFLKNSTFTHYDQDGWRNALLPVMDGFRMNFFGYGSSFPAFLGIYGSGLPINRFFLAGQPTIMEWDTARGRTVKVGASPTVSVVVNDQLQNYDGSGVFTIPTSFTGVVNIQVAGITNLIWSSGLSKILAFGNTVQSLDFSNSTDFAIAAQLPIRITSLANVFKGSAAISFPGIETWDTSRVTDISGAFQNCANFNQDISNWNTGKVTTLARTFNGASKFNQPIGKWNTANVITMEAAFKDARSFNQDLSTWSTTTAVNMTEMFMGAIVFNGNISTWDVSSVSNFWKMFYGATAFNGNISGWVTNSATDMSYMFAYTDMFNSNLASWNTANVTTMKGMFSRAKSFNKNISAWNTSRVTDMSYMFDYTLAFGTTSGFNLNSWDMSRVRDARNMFYGSAFNLEVSGWVFGSGCVLDAMFQETTAFNQDISTWDMRNVISVKYMLAGTTAFNKNLRGWNFAVCNQFGYMFSGSTYNGDLSDWTLTGVEINFKNMFENMAFFQGNGLETWNTENVVNMTSMFEGAKVFNADIAAWNTSKVSSMDLMFSNTGAFNRNISNWDVSKVVTFRSMFRNAKAFDGLLTNWNLASAVDMTEMFYGAVSFTNGIIGWNTSNVIMMKGMFNGAVKFNGEINFWDVSKITDFSAMFKNCERFNHDITAWDTSSAWNMSEMFSGALIFNRDLSGWNVAGITRKTDFDLNTPAWVLPKPNFPDQGFGQ